MRNNERSTFGRICLRCRPNESYEEFKSHENLEVPVLLQLNGRKQGINYALLDKKRDAGKIATLHGKAAENASMRPYEPFEWDIHPLKSKPDSLFAGTFVFLGRAPNNDVVIDDLLMSKQAVVFKLKDLGENLWYVQNRSDKLVSCDGLRLSYEDESLLQNSAKLDICSYKFKFYTPEGLHELITALQKNPSYRP